MANATNVHLWDISEQSVWERFCLGNAIWSPHLLAFTFLFVWLPDAWLQQQPWQRGSWQAENARGIAPLCCRPPSSTPSPPLALSSSKTAPGCCHLRVQLTGRQPLLSRLACPQIINPNAPAAFTKPHLINVPPHKYKLYPPPDSQLCCLFRSQYQHELGWFCWRGEIIGRLNDPRVDHVTAYGGCQRVTGGRGLSEEESAGQCRPPVHTDSDTLQPTVSYSPQILPVTLTPPAPRPPNPLSADPPTSTLVQMLLLLHAVQHRYALIYEPPRPLKTSGHFPAKRKIVPGPLPLWSISGKVDVAGH